MSISCPCGNYGDNRVWFCPDGHWWLPCCGACHDDSFKYDATALWKSAALFSGKGWRCFNGCVVIGSRIQHLRRCFNMSSETSAIPSTGTWFVTIDTIECYFKDGNLCCVHGPPDSAFLIHVGTNVNAVVIGQPFSAKLVSNAAAIYGPTISVKLEPVICDNK